MIQELDADGLACICGQVEGQLYPGAVIGGLVEELLNYLPTTVENVSLLPGIRNGVVAGGPVVEAQRRASGQAGYGEHLVRDRISLLAATGTDLQRITPTMDYGRSARGKVLSGVSPTTARLKATILDQVGGGRRPAGRGQRRCRWSQSGCGCAGRCR